MGVRFKDEQREGTNFGRMDCRDLILPKTFLLRKSLQRTHLTFGESFREKLQLQTFIVCTSSQQSIFFWVAEQRTEVCQLLQNLSRQRREQVLRRNLSRPDSYRDVGKVRTTLPACRQGSKIFYYYEHSEERGTVQFIIQPGRIVSRTKI